jgi:hypothetical protein
VQGTLALAFLLPSGVPAEPLPPPRLRLVVDRDERRPADPEFAAQPTGRAELPEPAPWAGRFAQAVVEALDGDRPASQLVRWTSCEVYQALTRRVLSPAGSARAVVRSVHVTEPADGVAEVTALVRRGPRCTAVALRLEGLDGRWQCTALELG